MEFDEATLERPPGAVRIRRRVRLLLAGVAGAAALLMIFWAGALYGWAQGARFAQARVTAGPPPTPDELELAWTCDYNRATGTLTIVGHPKHTL